MFQAQPNTSEESETFDKIKTMLIDMGIPKEQIAVKTSKVDDLGKIDLMNRDCPIRYIITVNALKEGWDCPFAYILTSPANKTSQVDVEQILGRILRQPYTTQHSLPLLNTSYVLMCSNDFHNTLENIVKGLNKAGFSRKDYRIGDRIEPVESTTPEPEYVQSELSAETEPSTDTSDDIAPEEVKTALEISTTNQAVENMEQEAQQAAQAYEEELATNSSNNDFTGGELGDMLNQNEMHISDSTIHRSTDKILPIIKEWRGRFL